MTNTTKQQYDFDKLSKLIEANSSKIRGLGMTLIKVPKTLNENKELELALSHLYRKQFADLGESEYFIYDSKLCIKLSSKTYAEFFDGILSRSMYIKLKQVVVTSYGVGAAERYARMHNAAMLCCVLETSINKQLLDLQAANGNGGNLEHLTLGNLCKQRVASSTNPNADIDTPSHHYNPNKYRGDQPKRNLLNQYFNRSEGTNETIRSDLPPTYDEAIERLTNYLNSREGKRMVQLLDWVSKKPAADSTTSSEKLVHLNEGDFVMLEGVKHKVIKSKSLKAVRLVEGEEVSVPAIMLAPYYD